MCVSQRRWTACRGQCAPALPFTPVFLLFLLPLFFLSSRPPLAQGALHIPKGYNVQNISEPPVLIDLPEVTSITIFSRDDFSLPCAASGNPEPTFRWVKDGEVFREAPARSGELTVAEHEPLSAYEGFFRCYASNKLGTAMTPLIRVIVEPTPVLQKQKKDHRPVLVGDSLVLDCNPPKSSDPPNIHWMDRKMVHIKQDERVMVGLDGNLYFSNLLKNDSRDDYSCHAQYMETMTILHVTTVGLRVSASNDVSGGKKPHLFRPLGSHTSVLALREHRVTLECIPKGLPTPKVVWEKKDGSLEDTSAQVMANGRWLVFTEVKQEDDGEYECRAINDHGTATHSFTLSVEAAPYWLKQPRSLKYAPGETVRLDCQAEGIPPPNVTWSMNGQLLSALDPDPRRSVSEDGVLIQKDVGFSDTAVYQCEAANKHGSILTNAYLYVVELPPKILSSDGLIYRVTEGGNIMMHCESFGSPRPTSKWEDEDGRNVMSDSRVSLYTNGTMSLSGVSHDDTGAYNCSIERTNISITAYLEVFNRTVIVKPPQDLEVLRGTDVLLHCSFSRDAHLDKVSKFMVVWKKGKRKVDESAPDDKYTVFGNGTLKVTNVQTEDGGSYTCEVITKLDHPNATGSITVVAPPDPPTDLTLSDIGDHRVTLSWTPGASHNSPITGYMVEMREEQHTEVEQWRWVVSKELTGEFQHVELELRPYCTYRFRVIAVNKLGVSEPSEVSDHRSTPPAVPDSNPENVRSNSSNPKTLIITWDEMDKQQHNGQGFMYKVSWRRAGGTDVHWNRRDVQSPPFVVNDTDTYTPFEIKVQAVNSLGHGPAPKAKIGHSGEDKPLDPPSGVVATVTNSTVSVAWKEAQNIRGQLQGYKIYVRWLGPQVRRGRRSLGKHPHHHLHHSGGAEEEERGRRQAHWRGLDKTVEVRGNKTSAEVSGLQLFSHYEVAVAAFNSKGEGPHSTPHRFNTPEGAPGPPASLTFESPSDRSLTLFWTPPAEPNGVLLGYMVLYHQELESSDSTVKVEIISDPSINHLELDSLDPSSYYIFKVIARTGAGDGPPITRRNATLLDGVPPSNISILISNTSMNLSWVPGERDRNHGFNIQYRRKGAGLDWQDSELVNSSQGFYSLTGLKPGSHYELMIKLGNMTIWKAENSTSGPVPSEMPGGFAAQGWLIGLISAIVLLLLILLILCLIKRSKGGKYAVKDKEDKEVDSEARPMKDETFGEYRSLESDADEKRSDSQPSLCGESKLGSDDSLAEYGDSVDIQFNEDGSFIGQYSGRGPVPHGNESSGPASPVNAVPPPPIAPSMSSVLNRPS